MTVIAVSTRHNAQHDYDGRTDGRTDGETVVMSWSISVLCVKRRAIVIFVPISISAVAASANSALRTFLSVWNAPLPIPASPSASSHSDVSGCPGTLHFRLQRRRPRRRTVTSVVDRCPGTLHFRLQRRRRRRRTVTSVVARCRQALA